MVEGKRRTLDELLIRYKREPNLRDIYVEGVTDKLFLEWFLRNQGIRGVTVYEINTVEIPTQNLFDLGLVDNNRSRVIALALYLQNKLSKNIFSLTCVADKDFDWLLEINYECDLLLFYDYSCLEMYFFDEVVLDKCLTVALNLSKPTAKDVLNNLSKILEDLFIIRATNEVLDLNMSWLNNFGKCCLVDKKKNQITFDVNKFIEKYLINNGKISQQEDFMAKLQELRTNNLDIKYKIRGHDFTELLCFYIKDFLSNEYRNYNPEMLSGVLRGCVNAEKLVKEPFFQRLLSRLSPEN